MLFGSSLSSGRREEGRAGAESTGSPRLMTIVLSSLPSSFWKVCLMTRGLTFSSSSSSSSSSSAFSPSSSFSVKLVLAAAAAASCVVDGTGAVKMNLGGTRAPLASLAAVVMLAVPAAAVIAELEEPLPKRLRCAPSSGGRLYTFWRRSKFKSVVLLQAVEVLLSVRSASESD